MKRLIILFTMIPLLGLGQGFGGGLFAGISATQMFGDDIGGFNKAGIYGGAFTDYRLRPKSTLQLELSFLQRGSKQTPTPKNGNTRWLFNLNYIEMPILYRWYGIKNMSLELGPSASFLISSRQEDIFGEIPNELRVPFHDFDFSGVIGLSYYLVKGKLEVNARYSMSIVPTSNGPRKNWHHHVMAFSLRWWFKTTIDQAREAIANNKVKVNVNVGEGSDE